jgi:hypothetical protein
LIPVEYFLVIHTPILLSFFLSFLYPLGNSAASDRVQADELIGSNRHNLTHGGSDKTRSPLLQQTTQARHCSRSNLTAKDSTSIPLRTRTVPPRTYRPISGRIAQRRAHTVKALLARSVLAFGCAPHAACVRVHDGARRRATVPARR